MNLPNSLACGFSPPFECIEKDILARAKADAELLWRRENKAVFRNLHASLSWAFNVVCSARIVDYLLPSLGPDIAIENSFLVVKGPRVTFDVPPHQDGINEQIQLDPCRARSVWIALTSATEENGCLHFSPGSHRLGYLPFEISNNPAHMQGRGKPLTVATPSSPGDFITAPISAGHAIVFDTRLVHRSPSNRTNMPRFAFNVRYVAPHRFWKDKERSPSLTVVSGDPGHFSDVTLVQT